ncbi:MAG TPA: hypothetical protein VFA27_13285 [Vicinamibacterales bacterium]|nr:hypothetical protein [Vicinamibacterales bacterium]
MTFDEDLRRAFDALSDRLHAEVQHQIDAAMAEVRAAVPPPPPPAAEIPTPPPSTPPVAPDAAILDSLRAMDAAPSLTDILDALATGASRHADVVTIVVKRGGASQTWRTIGAGDMDAPDVVRLPLTIANEPVAELAAAGAAASADALEILARHASRCLESMTAFKTARALARSADGPTDEALGEEDASARRYAKLLVSEIKLYHESDVLAGRRARDLAARLGGEIARARVLYDQRVPLHVRQRADYFQDELVRTLADGDPTLLEFQA